jgi:hypothetical protein
VAAVTILMVSCTKTYISFVPKLMTNTTECDQRFPIPYVDDNQFQEQLPEEILITVYIATAATLFQMITGRIKRVQKIVVVHKPKHICDERSITTTIMQRRRPVHRLLVVMKEIYLLR